MRAVMTGGDAAAQPLDYAVSRRWSRRRVVAVSLVLTLLVAAAGAWRWGPLLRSRANLLEAQWRCLTYDAPPGRVVFTSHPEELDALRNTDPAYRVGHRRASPNQRLDALSYAWYSVDAWLALPAGRWEPGPAFLHGRRTPTGERRLVALELSVIDDQLMIYCRSFKPASVSDDGEVARRSPRTAPGVYSIRCAPEPIRILAGQPDPNDESRFTLRCESGNQWATIRGQLHADGRVSLAVTDDWLLDRWDKGRPPPVFFSAPRSRTPSTQTLNGPMIGGTERGRARP